MTYYDKYLKYKNKYLELKYLVGGSTFDSDYYNSLIETIKTNISKLNSVNKRPVNKNFFELERIRNDNINSITNALNDFNQIDGTKDINLENIPTWILTLENIKKSYTDSRINNIIEKLNNLIPIITKKKEEKIKRKQIEEEKK